MKNQLEVSREQQRRILVAFITRLSDAQMQRLTGLSGECTFAQCNSGINAQIEVQNKFRTAIVVAADSLIDHDVRLIADTIDAALKIEATE